MCALKITQKSVKLWRQRADNVCNLLRLTATQLAGVCCECNSYLATLDAE